MPKIPNRFYRLYCGNCLEVVETLKPVSVDSIVTDPPYGLSNETPKGSTNRLFRGLLNIVFPDFNKLDTSFFEKGYLGGIPLNGSNLSREKVKRIIKSGISVPERTVDFYGYSQGWNEKIQTSSNTSQTIAERMLGKGFNPQDPKFLGDYLLDIRDAGELSAGDSLSSSLAQFFSSGFSVPVVPLLPSCGGSPLAGFLCRNASSFGEFVGFGDDPFRKSNSSTRVLTSGGAINGFMFGFDLRSGTFELSPTVGASDRDLFCNGACPKLIGAIPATSRLPSNYQPYRVRVVLPATDGTGSDYFFHVWLRDDAPKRISSIIPSGGFMGKDWDHGVPGEPFWKAFLRVAKPGAYLLAFGGTRTFHRLAVAIEDAGWELRDCIMWTYGSGFPKSHDVSKAIDKAAGAEREVVVGTKLGRPGMAKDGSNQRSNFDSAFGEGKGSPMDHNIYAPSTDAAKQWEGWGTALKPAWEPVIVARKPLEGTVANNVLKYGVGGLNIDGCRVGTEDTLFERIGGFGNAGAQVYGKSPKGIPHYNPSNIGRWPANLIHDGSEEVVGLFPNSKDGVAVGRNASAGKVYGATAFGGGRGLISQPKGDDKLGYGGTGSAARFFYTAKSSKKDRGEGNNHPTVKPTSLMQYLCRLVTPPDGLILDPFMGSGSTGKAAMIEGFRFTGIDLEEEHVEISRRRIQEQLEKRNA